MTFFFHKILILVFLHLFSERKIEELEGEIWESQEQKLGNSISFGAALNSGKFTLSKLTSELFSTVKQKFIKLLSQF